MAYDEGAEVLRSGEAGATSLIGSDGKRVRRLLNDYLDPITRYLGKLGIPDSEVDDVAQEVFLIATSKLDGVVNGTERPFLYAIASRVANNARRANGRRRRAYESFMDVGSDPAPSQEELTDHLRARVLVDSVLQGMAPDLRGV